MPRPYIQRTRKEWLDIYRRGLHAEGLFHSVTHGECPICGAIFKARPKTGSRARFCSRHCRNLFDKAAIYAREWGEDER